MSTCPVARILSPRTQRRSANWLSDSDIRDTPPCNLCSTTAGCSLLPSLSPECRARLVEATKQIAAIGLPQSRLESLVPRHCDACNSAGEESTQPPTLEAPPPSDAASEAAGTASHATHLRASACSPLPLPYTAEGRRTNFCWSIFASLGVSTCDIV